MKRLNPQLVLTTLMVILISLFVCFNNVKTVNAAIDETPFQTNAVITVIDTNGRSIGYFYSRTVFTFDHLSQTLSNFNGANAYYFITYGTCELDAKYTGEFSVTWRNGNENDLPLCRGAMIGGNNGQYNSTSAYKTMTFVLNDASSFEIEIYSQGQVINSIRQAPFISTSMGVGHSTLVKSTDAYLTTLDAIKSRLDSTYTMLNTRLTEIKSILNSDLKPIMQDQLTQLEDIVMYTQSTAYGINHVETKLDNIYTRLGNILNNMDNGTPINTDTFDNIHDDLDDSITDYLLPNYTDYKLTFDDFITDKRSSQIIDNSLQGIESITGLHDAFIGQIFNVDNAYSIVPLVMCLLIIILAFVG